MEYLSLTELWGVISTVYSEGLDDEPMLKLGGYNFAIVVSPVLNPGTDNIQVCLIPKGERFQAMCMEISKSGSVQEVKRLAEQKAGKVEEKLKRYKLEELALRVAEEVFSMIDSLPLIKDEAPAVAEKEVVTRKAKKKKAKKK